MGDGSKFVMIGLVLTIVSALIGGIGISILAVLVVYSEGGEDFFDLFEQAFDINVVFGLYLLTPIIFILGLVLSIFGRKNMLSAVGGISISFTSIVMMLMFKEFSDLGELMGNVYPQLFLMLAGGVLCIIGGIMNKD